MSEALDISTKGSLETQQFVPIEPNQDPLHSIHNLPRVGRSIGWLMIFIFLIGLSGILYGIYLGFQEVFAARAHHTDIDLVTFSAKIKNDSQTPFVRTIFGIFQFIFVVPVIFFAAKFPGQSALETLAIKKVSKNIVGRWLLYFAGFWIVETGFLYFINQTETPFMQSLRGTKHFGLAVVIAVIAPIIEELIFRGYLYKAWRFTRLGYNGALILISVLFSLAHVDQYHWPLLICLFCFAILMGMAREKTGSVLMPMLLHVINNTIFAVLIIYLDINI